MLKIKEISILAVIVGLNLGAPVYSEYYNNNNNHYSNGHVRHDQATTLNTKATDHELLKKIHDKTSSTWFSEGYDHVNVEITDGNVVLKGHVPNQSDKDKLEKEIRNIDGVKSLKSELRVQNPSHSEESRRFPQDIYATPTDDQLNKKIRDEVSKGVLWDSYKDVILHTSNGVVTLKGSVDSAKDQQKLVNDVQKIEGVKSVQNQLSVKNR